MDQTGTRQASREVEAFDTRDDGLAQKSRELTLGLLQETRAPFSRHQFTPGHITCTALVLHPSEPRVLFMHHHRLLRWLLPGGHVEEHDATFPEAAAREALEETEVAIDPGAKPFLAGIDVHGIPPNKNEPWHLHHDLIWCFRAASDTIAITAEATRVHWADASEWNSLQIAQPIRNAIRRAAPVA